MVMVLLAVISLIPRQASTVTDAVTVLVQLVDDWIMVKVTGMVPALS